MLGRSPDLADSAILGFSGGESGGTFVPEGLDLERVNAEFTSWISPWAIY